MGPDVNEESPEPRNRARIRHPEPTSTEEPRTSEPEDSLFAVAVYLLPSGLIRPGGPADFSPWREPWESVHATFLRALEGRKNIGNYGRSFAPPGLFHFFTGPAFP